MKEIKLEIFSPVQKVTHPLLQSKNVNLFIKRDDMIHPMVSGNKWRKLKYPLIKARAEGKTHLVTFGGAYSNHLLATAAAAAIFGFSSTGFVRGEEVENDHLFLCKLHGMRLIFTDRESYRDKAALYQKYFAGDAGAFFIDEGGASAGGAQGCSELVAELPMVYDHLFCACGTGTTAAGILNGLHQKQLHTRLHAVPVLKNGQFIADEIARLRVAQPGFDLHTAYHFGGYAKTTPGLLSFMQMFIETTGILIDQVYTAKMLYAIFDLAALNYFKSDCNILAIHSGGILGLLGIKHQLKTPSIGLK